MIKDYFNTYLNKLKFPTDPYFERQRLNIDAKFKDFSLKDTKKLFQLGFKDISLYFHNNPDVKGFSFANKSFNFDLNTDSKFKLVKYCDDKTIDIENNTASLQLQFEDYASEIPGVTNLLFGIINGKPGMRYNMDCPIGKISISYIDDQLQIFSGLRSIFSKSMIGAGLTISREPGDPAYIFIKHAFKSHPQRQANAKLGFVLLTDEEYIYASLENIYLKPIDTFLSYHAKLGENHTIVADILQSKTASLRIFSNYNESTTFTISVQATPKLEISMNQIYSYIGKPSFSINYDSEMISNRKSVQEYIQDFCSKSNFFSKLFESK